MGRHLPKQHLVEQTSNYESAIAGGSHDMPLCFLKGEHGEPA